uniref:cysteine--tRNA ligase n=1 Tax=Anthurium amnicola TaxID=1678845 RepID=A0A1D1XYN9_9ARAE
MGEPELQIYNTMTKQKEVFRPMIPGVVSMYVCGVTPYDYSHIGHARAYVCFDVLYRYLKHLGYIVNYVRNFTDIDDKIINRANLSGEDPLSLSSRFSQEFLEDMTDLQCLSPTHEPRVSDHIDEIKDMIKQIIGNGCAYAVDGDVYFSVDNYPHYGRLSGRKLDDNRAGGGGRVSVDLRKRNAADFALWKSAKPGEPCWESPWGPGRPGWHIECSAMSARYLGHSFDIHGGGQDLIFPHHENELAQSCAACPDGNISYWVHNGFVNKDNEKMSKSLNNFFTIRDITENYHPLALRFFLMRTHYRSDVNYTDRLLDTASDRVFYIYQTLSDCEEALTPFREGIGIDRIPSDVRQLIERFHAGFLAYMSDDLHTSSVLDDLMEPLKSINNNLKKFKGKKQQLPLIQALTALEEEVKDVLNILGLMSSLTCSEVLQQLKGKALKRAGLTEDEVLEQIRERTLARKNKEYEKSDKIRQELFAKGIALMDEPKGTIWRPREPLEDQSEHVNPESQISQAPGEKSENANPDYQASNLPEKQSNPAGTNNQTSLASRQSDDSGLGSEPPQSFEQN